MNIEKGSKIYQAVSSILKENDWKFREDNEAGIINSRGIIIFDIYDIFI